MRRCKGKLGLKSRDTEQQHTGLRVLLPLVVFTPLCPRVTSGPLGAKMKFAPALEELCLFVLLALNSCANVERGIMHGNIIMKLINLYN